MFWSVKTVHKQYLGYNNKIVSTKLSIILKSLATFDQDDFWYCGIMPIPKIKTKTE